MAPVPHDWDKSDPSSRWPPTFNDDFLAQQARSHQLSHPNQLHQQQQQQHSTSMVTDEETEDNNDQLLYYQDEERASLPIASSMKPLIQQDHHATAIPTGSSGGGVKTPTHPVAPLVENAV